MYYIDVTKIDEVLSSNMDNNDKINALNSIKENIKYNSKDDAKHIGKILLPDILMLGTLLGINHEVIDKIIDKSIDINNISLVDGIMFMTEFLSAGLAVTSMIALAEILKTYTVDTLVVDSYQRRLKPHI